MNKHQGVLYRSEQLVPPVALGGGELGYDEAAPREERREGQAVRYDTVRPDVYSCWAAGEGKEGPGKRREREEGVQGDEARGDAGAHHHGPLRHEGLEKFGRPQAYVLG